MLIQQALPVQSWGALLLRGELIFVYSSIVRLAEYFVGANAPLYVAVVLNPSRQAAYHFPLPVIPQHALEGITTVSLMFLTSA